MAATDCRERGWNESFIAQYLSPRLIREFRLFAVADHWRNENLEIDSIHDDEDYRRVRRVLAEQHKREMLVPDIRVVRYDRDSDRSLTLNHCISRDRPIAEGEARETIKHLARLWGFKICLEGIHANGSVEYYEECGA